MAALSSPTQAPALVASPTNHQPHRATDQSLDDEEDDPFDPFSTTQNLESNYYAEGYALGRSDGLRAGLIEGRVFGLEKGYEKFFAMGRLGGRSAVWGARLDDVKETKEGHKARRSVGKEGGTVLRLERLKEHPRLCAHVTTLHALAEAASLETRNTEDGVADFDDRFRRAEAKAKVIERVVAEGGAGDEDDNAEERSDGGEAPKEARDVEDEEDDKTVEREDYAVEVTMGEVETRLEEQRQRQRQRQQKTEEKQKEEESKPTPSAASPSSTSNTSTKKPPKAPKRAGVKVASGASRARGTEKNMEDFGIAEARALGRLL